MNMEYVYAAMISHSVDKEISDDAVTKVLEAAGVDVDAARVKALVASLSGVDIAEAMTQAVACSSWPGRPSAADAPAAEEAEEEEEEEDAGGFEGLGSLFG